MDLKSIQKVVSKIQVSLFKNSNTFSVGMLKSHFKGSGLQFKEHQVYAPGDDIRTIDWKLLAKSSHPFVKTYEEERNVEIIVAIDGSKSMFSGFEGISKIQAAMEICCLLYLLSEKSGDKIQGIVFLDEIITIPKGHGHLGISQFISTLHRKKLLSKSGTLNLEYKHKRLIEEKEILANLTALLRKKKEIILLSDFNEFISATNLKKILYKSNLHCFQILSPLDEASSVPFSLFSSSLFEMNKGLLNKMDMDKVKEFDSGLGGKFKKLRVNQRYLEDFVKEML
jgi:uncharacterized protein (DUF58 family)